MIEEEQFQNEKRDERQINASSFLRKKFKNSKCVYNKELMKITTYLQTSMAEFIIFEN